MIILMRTDFSAISRIEAITGRIASFMTGICRHPPAFGLLLLGLALIVWGTAVSIYRAEFRSCGIPVPVLKNAWAAALLKRLTSVYPMQVIKNNIRRSLGFSLVEEQSLDSVSGLLAVLLVFSGILAGFFFRSMGQLWYVKVLLTALGLFLPYHFLVLGIDIYRYRVEKHIPLMIDEFRGAFIKHQKVQPALMECSMYIHKSLGRIMSRAADSAFMERSLMKLNARFNNVWLNIFVLMLINYRQNGGELLNQLYSLNRTMTRHINIEKKKNKRLIWYEAFAVFAALFSIPAVIWVNGIILGNRPDIAAGASVNIAVGRLIGFSILSLAVVKILRNF